MFLRNKSPVLSIFVKHYLNPEGINYLTNKWFPAVEEAIKKQDGFISINYNKDTVDLECVNIKLMFKDREALEKWVKTPVHDDLVDRLDPYRVRDWHVATLEISSEDKLDMSKLPWETVIPRNIAYNRSTTTNTSPRSAL